MKSNFEWIEKLTKIFFEWMQLFLNLEDIILPGKRRLFPSNHSKRWRREGSERD